MQKTTTLLQLLLITILLRPVSADIFDVIYSILSYIFCRFFPFLYFCNTDDNCQTSVNCTSNSTTAVCEKMNYLTTGCNTVKSAKELHTNLSFPQHLEDFENYNPVLKEGDFDVGTYFNVLKHVSLDAGKILEYVYQFDGMGGYPILYVRNENEQPFLTYKDYIEKMCTENYPCPESKDYLDLIRTDNTPEGYWEWVILDIIGHQFYLYWHSNYDDHRIVCNVQTLDEIFQLYGPDYQECEIGCLTESDRTTLNNVLLFPTVECNESNVTVRLVTFTAWGGFFRRTYVLARENVNSTKRLISDIEYVNIVPFDIKIDF